MKDFTKQDLFWIRQPKEARITETGIEIITEPGTDLWQRTYYGFQNDNAPVLQTKTTEQYFSFVVKTDFESKHRFDQCGIVMYLDSENWLKGSIEYENDSYQRLGKIHVVSPEPPGFRLLHRMFRGRGEFQTDSDLSPAGRRRRDFLRYLRMQPGKQLLQGYLLSYADYGMYVERA